MYSSNPAPYRPMQILASLLLMFGIQGIAHAADDARLTRSTSGFENARGEAERHDPASLQEFEVQPKTAAAAADKQSSADAQNTVCCPYYVYAARTQLFDDLDLDGFHTYLQVNLDIDTDYFEADLYLRVFLRGSTGGWLEIFESDDFTIFGNSALDDYEVESELLSGFPADYYDVLVEVYDAYTGELVLEFGPAESPQFSLLPMEDILLDVRTLPAATFSTGSGGGSLSILSLALLAGLMRRRKRQ